MKDYKYDENNGLWYEKQGDYYIPCLIIPKDTKEYHIGIFGKRHLKFIKEYRPVLYGNLLTSCKLEKYLANVEIQAQELLSSVEKELAEKEGVDEKLKANDMMEWVARMNNIRARAKEVVAERYFD
ncbi:TnpV protein [Faecalibacillus intestinalis]